MFKFLMVAVLVTNLLIGGYAIAQPMQGIVFGAGDGAGEQVFEGTVVQAQHGTVKSEAGVSQQVAGGAIGAAVCAAIFRRAEWTVQGAAAVACGAGGQMAGQTLGTSSRPVTEVIVRLANGRLTSVLQEGYADLQAGDKVFLIGRGGASRVVRAM